MPNWTLLCEKAFIYTNGQVLNISAQTLFIFTYSLLIHEEFLQYKFSTELDTVVKAYLLFGLKYLYLYT